MTSRRLANTGLWGLAFLIFAGHFYFNNQYGYFRDEFNYIACGEHLDWGFVDHPPLIPLLVQFCRVLFGDSLRVIRLVPALASALTVVLSGAIARRLGGGPFAMLLTAVSVALAPVFLSDGSLLTTNCLEPLLWMGCVWFALQAIDGQPTDHPGAWLGFGVVLGLGLQEKYSIAIFAVALIAGLLLTPERRVLTNRWVWVGAMAAVAIFLPNFLWNVNHHWPFLELMRNIRASGRDTQLSVPRYFVEQLLLVGPLSAPLWLAGLAGLLMRREFRAYRFLGLSYILTFAFFAFSHGKNYYLAPVYPMLLAAGATWLERSNYALLRAGALILVMAGGAVLMPVTVPILPPEKLAAYLDSLPFEVPRSEVSFKNAALPQHYADQFGWQELVEVTARGWARLTPQDQRECAIFGQNYGQAGAIDFLGKSFHLPKALSGNQSYFLWGPRGYSGSCMIVIGDRQLRLLDLFESIEPWGETSSPYARENRIPVYLCRRPKFGSLDELWPQLKAWR